MPAPLDDIFKSSKRCYQGYLLFIAQLANIYGLKLQLTYSVTSLHGEELSFSAAEDKGETEAGDVGNHFTELTSLLALGCMASLSLLS